MIVRVDEHSGFCFGVTNAINKAESILDSESQLFCLGEIVHNDMEVHRLENKGLETITKEDFRKIAGQTVLIRAHGEPPLTYQLAEEHSLKVVDASCPVVLKLQERIRKGYREMKQVNGQILIYGKKGHAEVNGLVGQTENAAIILEGIDDLKDVDFARPMYLYSQTTKSIENFTKLTKEIEKRILNIGGNLSNFKTFDTICRQVSNRQPKLIEFSKQNDVVIFVSGKKSSNGKVLYETCKAHNQRTHLVEDVGDVDAAWFESAQTVGICGATSTPRWLMDKVADYVREIKL